MRDEGIMKTIDSRSNWWALFPLLLASGLMVGTNVSARAGDSATTPVAAAKGWRFRVRYENLPAVDNIAVAHDGSLYVTRELAGGEGEVVHLTERGASVLLRGLNRPDGLFLQGRRWLYVTEEVTEGRVIEYDLKTGKQREVVRLNNPEGIVALANGELLVVEDRVNGRIVRVLRNGVVEVVTSGLNRPEGLAVMRDGTLVFAETATGRVISWREGEMTVLVEDLDEPDQVRIAPDGALWITEDAQPGRLLRFKNGSVQTVLSGLMAPQGIAFTARGEILVAEQSRGRILAVMPPPPEP
jgi:sugar lactone lactonase YvrE